MNDRYDNLLEELGLDTLGIERRLDAVLSLFEQADCRNLEKLIEESKKYESNNLHKRV